MPYEYKMVPVPLELPKRGSKTEEEVIAAYLESVVNRWAAEGWEFYRVDTVNSYSKVSFLGKANWRNEFRPIHDIITFRREKQVQASG